MIPQSRIPTTPHHPPGPNPPECFPLSVLSSTPSHPKKSRKPLKASKFEPSPRPYPILRLSFQACEISIPFLYRPDFFQKLPPSPLPRPNILFLSSHPKPIRRSVPVPAPAPAQNRCRSYKRRLFQSLPLAVPHGSSFFRSPHPPDRRRTVNGPFCVSGSRLLSVYSSSPPECRPFRSPFRAQNAPASPTAPCSRPKPPIPFSPLGNRFRIELKKE